MKQKIEKLDIIAIAEEGKKKSGYDDETLRTIGALTLLVKRSAEKINEIIERLT